MRNKLSIEFMHFATVVEKIKPLPWRMIAGIITLSFIFATVVSTIVGYMIMGHAEAPSTLKSGIGAKEFTWSSAPTLTKIELDKILDRNIFNSEGLIGDVNPNVPGSNRPAKTSLPIKIVGIIYGGNPFNGLAMVENTEKNHNVNSFLVGDPLTADATAVVKEIHQDEIFIDNQGRLEYAPLEEPEVRRSTRKGKKTSKKAEGSSSLAGNGFTSDAPPESFKEEGFERKGMNIEMTQEYKNRLLTTDFASVLQDAKASPNVVDGVLKGWRLDRIRKDSIYEKAGVQNNDVIEEINGVMLSDAAQAVKTLQQLRNEELIELRIIRAGKPVNITFKVR